MGNKSKKSIQNKNKSPKLHKNEVFILILLPFLAAILSLIFKFNFLVYSLVFFGIPSLYLSIKTPHFVKRSLLFSLLVATPITITLDYMAYHDKSWYMPHSLYRFFDNIIPIENLVFAILWAYFGVIFYEHFFHNTRLNNHFSSRMKYLYLIVIIALVSFFTLYVFSPKTLIIPYFYLKATIVFTLVPLALILVKFHWLIRKLVCVGVYFLMVDVLYEYVGLINNYWIFTGTHFIGRINFFGQSLPLEELTVFILLGIPGIVCWYEFFADERK